LGIYTGSDRGPWYVLDPKFDTEETKMIQEATRQLESQWRDDERWHGIERTYTAEDVVRLRGSVVEERTLARLGAERLWQLIQSDASVRALGAITGGQAVQMVRAGLDAIYLSGWQVAADANLAGATYPDQSLYPVNSVPAVVRRLNNALLRADQIDWAEGRNGTHWLAPILADAEAGFGGPLNAYELMRAMIDAGAAGVHYEDQLASEKKCGHLGGKVLVPTQHFVRTLNAARLAADVCGVPTVLVARTDALSAALLTSDVDDYDRDFVTGERTAEGFYRVRDGIDAAISRGLAYAPYADLVWFETSTPDFGEAKEFAEAIHERFPGKPLAYNCSPSFNWRKHLDDDQIAAFQDTLGEWGYRFLFITLAGFHSLNASMFELARGYAEEQMPAYVRLQQREFELEEFGYTATRHQHEVGAGYFDLVTQAVAPDSETLALKGSTEEAQFTKEPA
jgi:isocitrate/methylisocitrate lyase